MNIIDHPELLTGAAFQNYLLETKEKGQLNQQIKLNKLSEGIILNELVSDVNILQKIPTLSSQSIGAIRPDTLCRFRGIVKDLYDIEFFCGHLHDPRTDRVVLTKYKDTIPNDLLDLQGIENDCQQKNIYARQPILLSSIPGESEWCQSRQTHPVNTNSNTVADVENTPSISHLDRANKRTLDISESSIVSPVNSSSKVRSDLSDMTTMQSTDPVTTHTVSPSSAHESVTAALAHSLNPSSSHVLAKVYDGLYDELRLNDMLEVIGIYTCDPTLVDGPFPVASDGDMDYNDGVEDCVDRLPASSLVPRLHCITLKRYALLNTFYLIPYSLCTYRHYLLLPLMVYIALVLVFHY